jgi:hypothetical protein
MLSKFKLSIGICMLTSLVGCSFKVKCDSIHDCNISEVCGSQRYCVEIKQTNIDEYISGQEVENESGRQVEFIAGDEISFAAGDEVPFAAGDELPNAGGDELPNAAGDEVPTAAGDEVPTTAGDEVPTTAGDELQNYVGLELLQFRITGDSNTDQVLSPGESAVINYFSMRNTGDSDILQLSGILSSDSPFITFTEERLTFTPGSDHFYNTSSSNYDNNDGFCSAGDDCGESTNFSFNISPNTPIGTMITIDIDLSDGLGNSYQLEHSFQVQ